MDTSGSQTKIALAKKVPCRDAWQREDSHFTPWLGNHGLTLLEEALGMKLEFHGSEIPVGPYYLDMLLKETETGRRVIVENQLERVDHGHLGQGLVYAAGQDAEVIVWIAPDHTDEHRAAVDWLNRHSAEGTDFYLLKLECLQIGETIAPLLRVISSPNEWEKAVKPREMPKYWEDFLSYLKSHGFDRLPNLRGTWSKKWLIFRPPTKRGTGWAWFAAVIDPRANRILVHLHLRSRDEIEMYRLLLANRPEIDRELPGVSWSEESADKLEIELVRQADPTDESDWPAQFQFLAENLTTFIRILPKHLEQAASQRR